MKGLQRAKGWLYKTMIYQWWWRGESERQSRKAWLKRQERVAEDNRKQVWRRHKVWPQ